MYDMHLLCQTSSMSVIAAELTIKVFPKNQKEKKKNLTRTLILGKIALI